MTTATALRFVAAGPPEAGTVAVLEIARPEAANALNDAVLGELTGHLTALAARRDCRALVLRGRGKHFSAGADLAWMQAAAGLAHDDNRRDALRLTALFEALCRLPMPSVALVSGSAFGGAVGLVACCDVAVAAESARFCLSEVRLGIMPAVILPYLARKLPAGQLRRHALSGRVFAAAEALAFGLVQRTATDAELGSALRDELNGLLAGAPEAQAALKRLHDDVAADGCRQGPHTAEAIAALRVAPAAQAGFAAFFAKRPPPWAVTLAPDWSLDAGGSLPP